MPAQSQSHQRWQFAHCDVCDRALQLQPGASGHAAQASEQGPHSGGALVAPMYDDQFRYRFHIL